MGGWQRFLRDKTVGLRTFPLGKACIAVELLVQRIGAQNHGALEGQCAWSVPVSFGLWIAWGASLPMGLVWAIYRTVF